MEINNLFNYLTEPYTKDVESGILFSPCYIYTYDIKKEYEVRKEIVDLAGRLVRPDNYLDSMILNVFDEMIAYLKNQKFLGKPLLDRIIESEDENPQKANEWMDRTLNDEKFFNFIKDKVEAHFAEKSHLKRIYLLVHGFTASYPHLRASTFIKRSENMVDKFTMIIFYPGEYRDGNYILYGDSLFNDDNLYRANWLNQNI